MGSSAQSSEMTSRGDGGNEREVQEEGDLCMHIANSGIPLQYSCLENPMDGGAW